MNRFKNIAVLIDAENANSNQIEEIINIINMLGNTTVRHVYGDFKQANLAVWDTLSLKYLLKQIHTPALVKGKNSSDIALVIDAMDLLFHGNHQGEFDCFCIVSSDSDFSVLAKYIRHKHKTVIGFGRHSTLDSFKISCNQFISINETPDIKTTHTATPTTTKPSVNNHHPVINANKLQQDTVLINALKATIHKLRQIDGWSDYSRVNACLIKNYPNLSPKHYGYTKWRSIIDLTHLFRFKTVKSALFIQSVDEKAIDVKPISTQNLLDDILLIINENVWRVDEWVHIGYLGSRLKSKGYRPKNFGFKSFTLLLENTKGIISKQKNNSYFFTLEDKSKIIALNQTEHKTNDALNIIEQYNND